MNQPRCFLLIVGLIGLFGSTSVHAASQGCDAINNGALNYATAELPVQLGVSDFTLDETIDVLITPIPSSPSSVYEMVLFGSMTITVVAQPDATGSALMSVTVPQTGTYNIRLSVFSPGEATVAITASCTQAPPGNQPPVAEANGPYTVSEGGSAMLNSTGSSDPDGDLLTFAWDLNDDGAFETPGASPSFSAAGRDGPDNQPIALQVCDDSGTCATDTAMVAIVNVAPSVVAGPDVTIRPKETLNLNASFTDPGEFDTHTATIDWGDGTAEPGQVDQTANSVMGSHRYHGRPQSRIVTVCVTDKDGDSGCDSLVVEVASGPPA